MDSFNATQLYRWMTEEMVVLPYNKCSNEKIPLTADDMEFLVQGPGKELWNHVAKHVFSRQKVDNIRKNILLSRLRAAEADSLMPQNDVVGNQLKLLLELREKRSAINDGGQTIRNIEEECKEVNLKHKAIECKYQFLQNQSKDIEKHILLLQLAKDALSSKVQLCKSSDTFFDRFKSDKAKDMDSSHKTTFLRAGNSQSTSLFSFCEKNEDSDLKSQAGCLNFLANCTAATKSMVEDKYNHMLTEKPSASGSLRVDSFSSMQFSCLTSTPLKTREGSSPDFETKKKELRKYLSENMLQLQPQLLHELLLRQTSKGIACLAGCHSEDRVKDSMRFLGMNNDAKTLKAELDKKFIELYVEINHNMISAARERNIATRAGEDLKSLMAQVEKELKDIFTIQATMVEKAYELVKIESEIASISGSSSYMEEFIRGKDLELASYSNGLKELPMPNEERLIKSLEMLKFFREEICGKALGNYTEFQRVMNEMKDPDFLKELGSFVIEGLISQEITSFTDYPLEYHSKTNVCGKLVPDFKLLNNGSCWQNLVCLEVNGSDDEIFDLCIQATMGHLPHCSPEAILLSAFKSKLFTHETDAMKFLGKSGSRIGSAHLTLDPQYLHKVLPSEIHEKEGSLEVEISLTNDIRKSHNRETGRILDEAEFLLSNWCEVGVNKCIPSSIVYEGKTFHQWNLEYLSALYKLKNT